MDALHPLHFERLHIIVQIQSLDLNLKQKERREKCPE